MGRSTQPLATRKVFTTGQVAKICRVAPRTVSKWFDAGRFKKGYRIPGSEVRRIPLECLVKFLKDNSMPLDDLVDAIEFRALFVGCKGLADTLQAELTEADGYRFRTVENIFDAGMAITEHRPQAVFFDFGVGRTEAIAAASTIKKLATARLAAVVGDDETEQASLKETFTKLFQRPFDPYLAGEWLADLFEKQREA